MTRTLKTSLLALALSACGGTITIPESPDVTDPEPQVSRWMGEWSGVIEVTTIFVTGQGDQVVPFCVGDLTLAVDAEGVVSGDEGRCFVEWGGGYGLSFEGDIDDETGQADGVVYFEVEGRLPELEPVELVGQADGDMLSVDGSLVLDWGWQPTDAEVAMTLQRL